MDKNKLLTIAIPNYNSGENLKKAILSCKNLNIDEEKYEILVVDNCSTDNSIDLVSDIKGSFKNFRIVRNEKNLGRVGNWNKCIDEARGRYILFLFSNEQIYTDNNINETIIQMVESNCGVCISSFVKEKDDIQIIEKVTDCDVEIIDSSEFCLDKITNFEFPFAPIQKNIYDMEIINKYNIRFIEEYDLNGDQYFSFNVCFNSENIILNRTPQIIWKFNNNRFHSKITINKVISDDLNLLNRIIDEYKLDVDYKKVLVIALFRVIFNKEWNNCDRKKAFNTIMNRSNNKVKFIFDVIKYIFTKGLKKLKKFLIRN